MALPLGTTGSLDPTFVPVRLVCLAVKRASALTLDARFPTVLSPPSSASDTVREPTAPGKLPTWHCPRPGLQPKGTPPAHSGWSLSARSTDARLPASQPPTSP